MFLIDYDECAGEGSGNTCEQGCVNNPGGFTCTCFDGFELVNDVQCRGRIIMKGHNEYYIMGLHQFIIIVCLIDRF